MQIRIKGAGWLLILGAAVIILGVAGAIIVRKNLVHDNGGVASWKERGIDPSRLVTKSASQQDKEIGAAATTTLQDGGFETAFSPVPAPLPGQPAHVSGELPKGWFDLSHWANVDITYSQETRDVQDGKACLRVDVGDIRQQAAILAAPIKLIKGKTYVMTAYMKASRDRTPVLVGIRMRGKPYFFYGQSDGDTAVGNTWTKVSVTAVIKDNRYPFEYLLFQFAQPNVTIWIDNVNIQAVN